MKTTSTEQIRAAAADTCDSCKPAKGRSSNTPQLTQAAAEVISGDVSGEKKN
jgi:hypothetical protein